MLTNESIKEYIEFFNDDNQVFYSISNGYINYHKTVQRFIKDCYDSNMMNTEYMSSLEEYIDKNIDLKSLIETSELSILKAILTFYIRGERFSEGMIAKAIDEKIFLTILKKLV